MIRQDIRAEAGGYRWTVRAFYAVSRYDVEDIMTELWKTGCPATFARRAYENMRSGQLDNGLTYSNFRRRESVMVVGLTRSAGEFFNTLVHELCHLSGHVSAAYDLDRGGEEVAYLTGDVAMRMYPQVKELLCECCRAKQEERYG